MEDNKINDLEEKVEEIVEEIERNEDKQCEMSDSNGNNEEIIKKLEEKNMGLFNKNEKMQNEMEALQDKLIRTVAEYDNYRKRTAKEKEGIYTDACEDVLKEIIPILDNLERALLVDGEADDIKKGVEMTMKQFKESLCKLGVEEISTEEGFDPNFHNAVMHIEDENYDKNEVAEVFLKGYKKGDRVIRHSMVKVVN